MAFVARVNETEIKNIPPKGLGSPLRQAAGRYVSGRTARHIINQKKTTTTYFDAVLLYLCTIETPKTSKIMETALKKSIKLSREENTIELIIYGEVKKSDKKKIEDFMDICDGDETQIELCENGSTRYLWRYLRDDYGTVVNTNWVEKSVRRAMREDFDSLQSIIS